MQTFPSNRRYDALMPEEGDATEGGRRFDRFLREQREALMQFLRKRTRSEEDAQDAAQESLVRLMRYRSQQPEVAWKPLLYRIAVNVANDQSRWARRRGDGAHVALDEAEYALPHDAPHPDERLIQQQELARIGAVIETLPPRCQEIYLLSRVEGMKNAEIARHCGISLKAVEKHMTKAMSAVRHALGTSDWQSPQDI